MSRDPWLTFRVPVPRAARPGGCGLLGQCRNIEKPREPAGWVPSSIPPGRGRYSLLATIGSVDPHTSRELAVFDDFLVASKLDVVRESIRKCEPFDILCRAVDGTDLAFQITEIVDEDWAGLHGRMSGVGRAARNAYASGAHGWKDCIQQRFGDCDIGIVLLDDVGARDLAEALPHLFEFIAFAPDVGAYQPTAPNLASAVSSVRITRVGFSEPNFTFTGGGVWLGDPGEVQLQKKMERRYPLHPAHELIAYYARQRPLPERADELRDWIKYLLPASSFRRVWVLDGRTLFVSYP